MSETMGSKPADASDGETRLRDVLAQLMELVENGQPIDQAVWLARHPRFRDQFQGNQMKVFFHPSGELVLREVWGGV